MRAAWDNDRSERLQTTMFSVMFFVFYNGRRTCFYGGNDKNRELNDDIPHESVLASLDV